MHSHIQQIVVVSDIHLGEDLIEYGPPSLQRFVNRLNEEFVSFLSWLKQTQRERPVLLAINGDMFDFIKLSLRPTRTEAETRFKQEVSHDEWRFGLENTPERVLWKLERILEHHRPLFILLADLVGEGHSLHIIAGNHDREFYYPQVIERLRATLADLYFSRNPARDSKSARDDFATRMQIDLWFYHFAPAALGQGASEQAAPMGGVYVEHGHQYDAFCSFEYLLTPVKKPGDLKIALPLSHRAIPFFADLVGDMSTHNLDTKGFVEHLKALFQLGPRLISAFLIAYFKAVVILFKESGDKERIVRAHLQKEHEQERDRLAHEKALPPPLLKALDDLHARPAEFDMFKMAQGFYADRFIWLFALLVVLALDLLFVKGALAKLISGLLVACVMFVGLKILGSMRAYDTRVVLRKAAARIDALLRPDVIIFGHSHKPELCPLAHGHYINIGSWISRAAATGEAEWGMTFAWIDLQKQKPSGLYRWVGTQKNAVLVQPLSPT